jgi:hypothetical protein
MDKIPKNIEDAYKWSLDTAEALRAGDLSRIDMNELIDEVESIAGGLRRELVSVLREIIEALLTLQYAKPTEKERRETALRLTHAQGQLQLILDSAPSLRNILTDSIDIAYQDARRFVSEDHAVTLPEACPIPMETIVEDPYERLVAQGKL